MFCLFTEELNLHNTNSERELKKIVAKKQVKGLALVHSIYLSWYDFIVKIRMLFHNIGSLH